MNFCWGHSGTKVRCESRLFSRGKTPEFTKMGEIHELLVLALSWLWFAGATPEKISATATKIMFPQVFQCCRTVARFTHITRVWRRFFFRALFWP